VVWANTVGPYDNRQETYAYFQLPYCQGAKQHEHYHETIGEALQGMELVNSGLDIRYLEPVDNQPVCTDHHLGINQLGRFEFAITHQYYFSMFVDDLPIGGKRANKLRYY
jgi:transmembrane 9 superfamily protein 3